MTVDLLPNFNFSFLEITFIFNYIYFFNCVLINVFGLEMVQYVVFETLCDKV